MTRAEICERIEDVGIMPVVRTRSAELAMLAAASLLEGGVSVFEITMTVPGAVGVIRSLIERFGDRVLVGAGTVLSPEDATACLDAGAQFIVSPGLDLPTVKAVRAREVPMLPGALTPTEVMAAWKAGADIVKIFPCSAMGGAKYLRTLKAPLPHVKLMPTGGVSLTTAREYLDAGAVALGLGAELVDVAALEEGRGEVISERARQLVELVRNARSPR